MNSLRTISILTVLALAVSVQAGTTYTGSLSTANGGITGNGEWGNPSTPITLNWTVSQNTDGSWHYQYQFNSTGVQGSLSHLLIETCPNFTISDIANASPSVTASNISTWTSANGNPNIPSSLYGVKFDGNATSLVTVQFDSDRTPVWGDFYAKDGSFGQVWNAGFTASDTDPLAAIGNGSVSNHILRPDTVSSTVPAPGTLLISSLGTGIVGWLRRRRAI
jgi:hypothetical protein